jgi:hypothetical protein
MEAVRKQKRKAVAEPAAASWELVENAFILPPVHLSSDLRELEHLLATHAPGGCPVGYDIEWRPAGWPPGAPVRPPEGTALVQVSSPSAVVLVPLSRLRSAPAALVALLGHSETVLLGCGVAEDAATTRLTAHGPAVATGARTVDLSAAAHRAGFVPPERGGQPVGLAYLVHLFGGPTLQKRKQVTLSNWAAPTLTAEQVHYAATDAYAGGWVAGRMHAALTRREPGTAPFLTWLRQEADEQAREQQGRSQAQLERASRVRAALIVALKEHATATARQLALVVCAVMPQESKNYVEKQLRATFIVVQGGWRPREAV